MATTESLDLAQQLYVGYYGRPADPDGQAYWADVFDGTDDLDQALNAFGTSDEYTENFGSLTNEQLVNNLYQQMFGRSAEAAGLDYWTGRLDSGESTLVNIAKQLADGATDDVEPDLTTLNNKITVANTYTEEVTSQGSTYEADDIDDAQDILADVDDTDASVTAGNAAAAAEVASNLPVGETFTLTNDTDVATANIFEAPMVYTPDGSDRILSLQNEDVLTGTEGRTDNMLNAVMGQANADEGSGASRTPVLNNIQTLNLDYTGTTSVLDVRFADDVQTININKITNLAGNTATVTNITTAAADLKVANAANGTDAIVFNYQRGVLDDTVSRSADVDLDNVLAATITQNALGTGAGVEGFETVELNAVNGVDINTFSVNETEDLTITGDSYLDVVLLTDSVPVFAGVTAPEYSLIGATGGFVNPGAPGYRTIDASAFTGDLSVDITNAVGGFSDPDASGTQIHTVVTGGSGDDTFWTRAAITSTTAENGDVIDGSIGTNKLVSTSNIATNAENQSTATITNIQSLELRQQGIAQTADLSAFDSSLTNVMLRDENPNAAAATFTLTNMLDTTDITLHHGVSEGALPMTTAQQQALAAAVATVVNVRTDDASGADDTVVVTVVNDLNTGTFFDYTLNIDGDLNDGDTVLTDGSIENVTINDNDSETNILTLGNVTEHTGTIKLVGGVAGQDYTVASTLIAANVDGAEQASNLRLTVGDTTVPIETITQDIKLGSGDDILTFANIDDFDKTDTLTDAGGSDVVRAAFSKDSALDLTGIEGLHIVANANVALDMTKADVETLVIMSNRATDQLNGGGAGGLTDSAAEPFNVTPLTTNVITLSDTALTDLNFFGDLDTNDDMTAANVAAAEIAGRAAGAATSSDLEWCEVG